MAIVKFIVRRLQESNRKLVMQERLRQEKDRRMPEKKELNISDQPIPDDIDETHTSPDEEIESTIPSSISCFFTLS